MRKVALAAGSVLFHNGNGMKDTAAYTPRLEEALAKKISQMEREGLPQLREQFRIVQSAFRGITGLLLRKGVIHEDPYRSDNRFSEVTVPPETVFTDQEKLDQMSVRISQYMSQLDFLVDYYQFSVDFLNMDRIKRLLALLRYFNFTQLTITNTNLNTRCLAEFLDQIRKGGDSISSGVLNDSVSHLDRASRLITAGLRDLTLCHKEKWKLEFRLNILSALNLEREYVVSHQEDVVRALKRKYQEQGGKAFYPELVQEILQEDYAHDAEARSLAILRELAVQEDRQKDSKVEKNFRAILHEGIRYLSSLTLQLEDMVKKLEENSAILEAEQNTFGEKLKRMLRHLFGQAEKPKIYEVEFIDPVTAAERTEKLNFTDFMEDLRKKAKNYAAASTRGTIINQRLETADEDLLYAFLEKGIEELQVTHRRLIALDTFFKTEVDREDRARLHGIKLEIETIKGTIIKVNQKKHEYVSQREEMEQMKRLGIKAEAGA